MRSMTSSLPWYASPKVVVPIPRQRYSTARASSRRTSVAHAASTREKKVKGRKRHVVVDVLGLILAVVVTPASVQDRDGAAVLREAHREYPTLSKVWVDGAYTGEVISNLRAETSLDIEMVKRSDDVKGFAVLPKRWIGERTNGWFGKFRLLSKEYERTLQSSRSDILHAMSMLMLRRLTVPAFLRKEHR